MSITYTPLNNTILSLVTPSVPYTYTVTMVTGIIYFMFILERKIILNNNIFKIILQNLYYL
jgi:hypothetical protein